MIRTEDRLRAALLDTAEQIPSGGLPPLALPAQVAGRGHYGSRRLAGQSRRWPSALAAAAAVCLIIGLSVTLAGRPRQLTPAGPTAQLAQFPPYYVALQQASCGSCGAGADAYWTNPDRAVVLSTLTGTTLATIAVPKPYGTFAFVHGTADDRDFILGAQRLADGSRPYPGTKLYLLRLNPSARPGHRAQLTALAVPLLAGRGYELGWVALSPNGQLLAAMSTTTATNNPTLLRVYNLGTGASRTWVLPRWAQKYDGFQDAAGPPSWSTDSRSIAFVKGTTAGSAELVLLNTRASAASFSAESRSVPLPRPPGTDQISFLPGAPLLTADGQHVLEEVINPRELSPSSGPYHTFALDLVNLRTGTLSQLRHRSEIFYVLGSDPSGSAVIVSVASLPPLANAILAWTAHGTTPIEVPADTIAVAW
jgi:hypothetical protein